MYGTIDPRKTTMKNTSVNISDQLHADFKAYCAKKQTTMGDMMEIAITEKMVRDNYER